MFLKSQKQCYEYNCYSKDINYVTWLFFEIIDLNYIKWIHSMNPWINKSINPWIHKSIHPNPRILQFNKSINLIILQKPINLLTNQIISYIINTTSNNLFYPSISQPTIHSTSLSFNQFIIQPVYLSTNLSTSLSFNLN